MENIRGNKTATIGLDQRYQPLHVEAIKVDGLPAMRTLWRPTPDEMRRLVRMEPVVVTILGNVHPPIRIDVEDSARHPNPGD